MLPSTSRRYAEKSLRSRLVRAGAASFFALAPAIAFVGANQGGVASATSSKLDNDRDGIANKVDPDVDGDGIRNGSDSDVDGDRIPNVNDHDVDGDGDLNGATKEKDIDGDSSPDTSDDDMDGDG